MKGMFLGLLIVLAGCAALNAIDWSDPVDDPYVETTKPWFVIPPYRMPIEPPATLPKKCDCEC